jgi:hypothetical protein
MPRRFKKNSDAKHAACKQAQVWAGRKIATQNQRSIAPLPDMLPAWHDKELLPPALPRVSAAVRALNYLLFVVPSFI